MNDLCISICTLSYIQFILFYFLHNTSGSSINKSEISSWRRFISRLLVWR